VTASVSTPGGTSDHRAARERLLALGVIRAEGPLAGQFAEWAAAGHLRLRLVRSNVEKRERESPAQRPRHAAVTPPSTGSAAPVMNEASSDRRKSAALAISSGRPVRPSGTAPAARRRTRSSGSIPAVDF
jgi:hypothetical protein